MNRHTNYFIIINYYIIIKYQLSKIFQIRIISKYIERCFEILKYFEMFFHLYLIYHNIKKIF